MVSLVFRGEGKVQVTLVVRTSAEFPDQHPDLPEQPLWRINGLTRASTGSGDLFWPVLREWQELSLIYRDPDGEEAPAIYFNGESYDLVQLDPATYWVRWRLKGQIGKINWEIKGKGNQAIGQIEAEVFPLRLSYRQEFRQMLHELQQVCWGLTFSHRGAEVAMARGDSDEDWSLPSAMKGEVGRWWLELRRLTILPPTRRRYVPSRWTASIRESGHSGRMAPLETDKQVLTLILLGLLELLHAWAPGKSVNNQWLPEAMQLQIGTFSRKWYGRLEKILLLPPWSDLQPGMPIPANTHQRVTPRLRSFIQQTKRLHTQWKMHVEGPMSFRLKDTPTLYEYWVMVYLIRFLGERTDFRVANNQLSFQDEGENVWRIARGSWIGFVRESTGEELRIYYNPQIESKQSGMPAQRPDFMIERREKSGSTSLRFVLEVKYQAHRGQHGWGAHPDALAQVHRYRDALITDLREEQTHISALKLLGGAVIFPHPETDRDFSVHPHFKGLEQVGIGAIPLTPGAYGANALFDFWLMNWLGQSPDQLMERRIEYRIST